MSVIKKTGLILLVAVVYSGCSKISGPTEMERPQNHIAFVLLSDPVLPSETSVIRAFDELVKEEGAISVMEEEPSEEPGGGSGREILAFNVKTLGTVFVALMDMPVPEGEAEEAFEYSVSSLAEEASVEGQKAHLLVTAMGIHPDAEPLDVMMTFSSVVAAVVKATPSVGVYWGNAGATHTREFFLSIAEERDASSGVLLWSGFSQAGEPDGRISFLSLGMSQFALPDLYLICKKEDRGEALEMFYDLLTYQIKRGSALPEGDTIGRGEDQRIPVAYVESPAGTGEAVWKVVWD